MEIVVLTKDEVIEISEKIKSVKVCLIGDICLDLYWRADMKKSRLSRETPHYPLPIVDETYTPGGGGNVINNIFALGVDKLISVSAVGPDWRGLLLTDWFKKNGISTDYIITRENGVTPCYIKPLRMGISDVIYEDPRLDFENYKPLSADDEEKILKALDSAVKEVDIIAVSDQMLYGIITPKIRKKLCEIAKNIPVIVDSRDRINEYCGVIVKPNEVEAALAVGQNISDKEISFEEAEKIAKELQNKNNAPVIITLGGLGALWYENGKCQIAPTVKA
ncbi:MAG: sugar kinase, partial [Clostridia bacterium]|nr:sugar kinase [Clostridia bacterium]